METLGIWNTFSDELYFFILKRVNNKDIANDILQNTFLKIHKSISSLKQVEKAKAWVFQIARNEIANHFNAASTYTEKVNTSKELPLEEEMQLVCCFDKLINDLPEIYREAIEMVYIEGHKQKDVAEKLGISLENTKARIRRGKDILKEKFQACCKYEVNKKGKLVGEPNCSAC
ncbi:MAG: sigma-70 family RNA polymerase sigma factor [Bacteroidota bacterium]